MVVGYLDADGPAPAQRRRRAGQRAARRARRCCTAARWWPPTTSTTCPTTASSTRTATSCRATSLTVVRIGGVDVALTVCEDLWQAGGPFAAARRAGVGLVVTSTARRTSWTRTTSGCRWCAAAAAEAGATVAYVNMVGGQDELVFDGDSMIVDRGRRAAQPGRRSSPRSCWSRPRPAGRGATRPTAPAPASASRPGRRRPTAWRSPGWRSSGRAGRGRRPGDRRHRRPARRRGRGVGGAGAGPARLRRARTASARSCSACPAASTRRWSPRIAVDALGPDRVVGVSMPSRLLVGALPRRRRRPGQAHRPGLPGGADPADGRRVPGAACRCPAWPWRTCRPGCAA